MFTPPDQIIPSDASEEPIVSLSSSTIITSTNKTITNSDLSPTSVIAALEAVQSGVPTRTTATLTPTTLKNIAHLFEIPSVEPPEAHSNQAGFVPPPVQPLSVNTFVDNKTWGGGIATITSFDLSSTSPKTSTTCSQSLDETMPSVDSTNSNMITSLPVVTTQNGCPTATVTRRAGGRKPLRDDRLSPEEEERRRQRRERNKQAAARCRKRRLDQTNRLQGETDVLEEKRMSLQQEIQQLQQQREELQFLLAAHKNSCKKDSRSSLVVIKDEPIELEETLPSESAPPPVKPRRPTSLPVVPLSKGVCDLGITIETPSNALRGLGLSFESMIESGTGLTPVTSLPAPSTGLTPLTTPIVSVSTAPSTNCGTQQRSSNDISPEGGPPKLVSL